MYRNLVIAAALLMPAAAMAQKQEVRELQRDVANLSGDVRNLQQAVTELKVLLQQTYESSQKSSTGIAVLDSAIRDRIREQLTTPVTNLNNRLDQVSADFQGVKDSVSDLSTRMGKLQQQLEDINNAIKVMQAPAAPPPGAVAAPGTMPAGTPPGGSASAAPANTTPPQGMSARQLYDSAMRDRSGGQLDLALQEFQQYLQYYGTTDLAPNAQFYVGQILYDRGDFQNAMGAFDTVLERYPDNNKTPDALYMKGMSLLRLDQKTAAGKQFLEVIEKYPRSEVAEKAKAQRKNLGLSVPGSAPARKAAARRRR